MVVSSVGVSLPSERVVCECRLVFQNCPGRSNGRFFPDRDPVRSRCCGYSLVGRIPGVMAWSGRAGESTLAKRRVLITGVAGVVGQACVQHLSDRYELSGLDIKDPGNVPMLVADIADLNAILPAFAAMDAVIHLAGNPSVHSPWDDVFIINI